MGSPQWQNVPGCLGAFTRRHGVETVFVTLVGRHILKTIHLRGLGNRGRQGPSLYLRLKTDLSVVAVAKGLIVRLPTPA